MINAVNNMFGFSTTVAVVRATNLGMTNIIEGLCNAFVQGFGYSNYYGTTIYQQVKGNSNLLSIPGIGNNPYSNFETQIYNILQDAYPAQSINNNKILALVTNSVIFGYYTYSDINISDVVDLVGLVLYYTASLVNNNQIFTIVFDSQGNGHVTTPFTQQIVAILLENDYANVLNQMSAAPKNSTTEVVNYNWFELQNLFSEPDLELMRDIENQYYYVSGQLIYNANESNLPDCTPVPLTINTNTGTIVTSYLLNEPCVDRSQYIGPISGTQFYRVFNDGPFSSGDFNSAVEQEYINLDKSGLQTYQYESNADILYSFLTGSDSGYLPISFATVFIDANGEYNISQEYLNVPESYECSQTYSGTMHIGDNRPKIKCQRDIHGACIDCTSVAMTGFKFATLQLNQDWYDKYAYLRLNPVVTTDRILQRALNIFPYSYISEFDGQNLNTTNPNSNLGYLGYPQMTGQNSLPNIAFFQTFSSPTFGVIASIGIYPAIGTSSNGTDINSDRTYTISKVPLFSGTSSIIPPFGESGVQVLPFITTLNSSGNIDDIARQFFGMGDNFGNQYLISEAIAYNAGYEYTGIVLSGNGVYENIIVFNNTTAAYPIMGSPAKNINFISGYSDIAGINQYSVTRMFAQNSSGNLVAYYYLDNRNLPNELQVPENQWYSFCPLTDIFEANPLYKRVSGSQLVENYLPRFASGAYSMETETFLYPNAKIADQKYIASTNGFPLRIKFVLNIREEAIRELYARYYITPDGLITTSPYYVDVLRPSSEGIIDYNVPSPLMNQIFVPNSQYYDYEYNFNNFGIDPNNNAFQYSAGLTMVDNNWSPYINRYFYQDTGGNLFQQYNQVNQLSQFTVDYFTPSGKNSMFYNNTQNPFYQGIRLTGNGGQLSVWFTGTGNSDLINFYQEIPMANGVFHYYQPVQITGYLLYTPPYFDLSSGYGYANQAIQEAFSLMVNGNSNAGPEDCFQNDPGCSIVGNSYFQNISGVTGFIQSGYDPIYLEYMGGRSGGFLVQQEGGYHSRGIIGDLWNNFFFTRYGMMACEQGSPCCPPTRWAANDVNLVLVSSNPQATKLFARAMSYTPFNLSNVPFIPFNNAQSYNYTLGSGGGTINLALSGDFGTFALKNYLPLKNINHPKLYDHTGMVIGPFDRDIEIGVVAGNQLWANANILCNGNQITDPSGFGGCDINAQIYGQSQLDSGIFPGEFGKDSNFTIFAVIPKGGYVTINLSGLNSGQIGFIDTTGISGVPIYNTNVSLRSRKMINSSIYDQNLHKGEKGWIDPFYFIKNGIEQQFNFSTNEFEDLESQIYQFTVFSESGLLYPVPSSDFTGKALIDQYGNFTFPNDFNVQKYWINYSESTNQAVIVSGIRQGSRISFQFEDIEIEYDAIPYQTHSLITPSGTCTISGEMGYLKQAEASIFTQGIILQDATDIQPDGVNDYFPLYYSDVLSRIPYLTGISGNAAVPIIAAPSEMIQRQFVPIISGGEVYNKLLNYPPYDYNKLCWQAFSDLETLNEGETLEATLPDDPMTFSKTSIIFSASQGQPLPNGKNNPIIDKVYDVTGIYQLYDSIATDAIINSGKCITNFRGQQVRLQQSIDLSGLLASLGTSLTMIKNGLI